jgi:hypothetical protein
MHISRQTFLSLFAKPLQSVLTEIAQLSSLLME